MEHYQKYCSRAATRVKQRSFWVLASFCLGHRPLPACSLAKASPGTQKSSLRIGSTVSSNAPARGFQRFRIPLTTENAEIAEPKIKSFFGFYVFFAVD
jgi:hypothetical protein